jgi:flagellar motility protein MotE (MotC chaperone)
MAKKQPQLKKRVLRTARFRLMPLTMAMLSLLFVSRLNEIYINSRELNDLLSVRNAQASDAPKEDAKKEEKPAEGEEKEEGGHGEEAKEEGGHGGGSAKPEEEPRTYGEGKLTLKQIEELKARETKEAYSQTELDLLQNLTKRREELDQRAKELELKSSVLDATEKRINDKIVEMKGLQEELTKVIAIYKEQQNSEIMSLVKIYENMKPLDAAAIFNEMDMPILLEVIDKMSERKVAPVLAGMSPKRARDVTQELAEMRKGRQRLNDSAQQAGQR